MDFSKKKNQSRAKIYEDDGYDSYSFYEGTDVAEDDESVKSTKNKKFLKKIFNCSRAKTREDEVIFFIILMKVPK